MHDGDVFGSIFGLFLALCVMLPVFIVIIWSVIWAYKDGNERGKPGWLVALMVFFVHWPVGLLIWFVFRPEKVTEPTHAGKVIEDDEFPNPEDYK
jgi:cbb3-type cytochrome oxidase subunit 3